MQLNYDLFYALQGLSDGLHAVVFVDNHDNQRGHGSGGQYLHIKSINQGQMITNFCKI